MKWTFIFCLFVLSVCLSTGPGFHGHSDSLWNELLVPPGGHTQRPRCQELCVSELRRLHCPHWCYCWLPATVFGHFPVSSDFISSFDSIDDNMQVKITDNALARDLFPMDYHCLGDNENRPVRWMALESLLHNDFSSLSDVVIPPHPDTFCSVWGQRRGAVLPSSCVKISRPASSADPEPHPEPIRSMLCLCVHGNSQAVFNRPRGVLG